MIAAARVPDVPSRLPFVGSALALGRDPDRFFDQCRRRHGDTFALRLAGRRRTFLCDPLDHATFFQTRELSFLDLSGELGGRVFGYDWIALRGWGAEALMHQLSVHLRGGELEAISERMLERFPRVLTRAACRSWTTGRLYERISELVFAASSDALFGDGFYTPEVYQYYRVMDGYFPLLALGWPVRALPRARRAQAGLAAAMASARSDRCRLMAARAQHYEEHRVPLDQRHHMDASLVWASQANTIGTAFWTLLYLLRDPGARARVVAELREVLGGAPIESLGPDVLKRLVVIDSAISEALRLQSYVVVLRRAAVPVTLPLRAGGVLPLAAGEEVGLYPRLLHLDPEVYPDPFAFVVDRFVGAPSFSKAGKRLTFPLLPFGGGAAICPGRFFARNEVKVVVAALLGSCDVELCSAETPAADRRRVGFGMLPPERDVPFRLRRR